MDAKERDTIKQLLRKFGIGKRYKGYYYTIEAVSLYMDIEDIDVMITKDIYSVLAIKFGSDPASIERCMRTVIELCWRNNESLIFDIAGYEVFRRPTNSEFLDMLANYIEENLR